MSENGSDSDQNSSGRKSKNGDEHIQSMSVGEIDPAILFVRERAKIRYTKEDLLEIAKNPASRSKPDFLDPNEVCVSVLDPEKWNLERKKSDTPENGPKSGDNGDVRRRAGDPRERIRKENDGIVLSPQRRSFNSGCFVPANKDSLGTKNDAPPMMVVREMSSSTRRIGSGRIIRDTWDSEKDSGDPEFGFGRGLQTRNNERDDKYGGDKYGGSREENKFGERRSFGREIEKEKDSLRGRNMRFGDNRRRYSDNKEDEPEWFSSGPISQNDTIELRGFDDEKNKKKLRPARAKRVKEWQKKKENVIVEDKETDDDSAKKTYPDNQNLKKEPDEEKSAAGNLPSKKGNDQKKTPPEHSFDFDEFLKGENISGLLSNQPEEEATKLTSRFSRWFRKDSPNKDASSGGSSIHEDNHELMKDINESSSIPVTIRPPIDSNTHFAPISPADNDHGGLENLIGDKARPIMGQTMNIMDLLARGKQQNNQSEGWKGQAPTGSQMVGGNILSLDELEAEIRQHNGEFGNIHKGMPSKPDEEMTAAFKKLLLQAGETSMPQNGPMNKPNSAMSLLEMLKHSQQQDEARFAAAQAVASQQQQQLLNAMHAQHHQPNHIHNDLGLKLQQKQQFDMIGKLMAAGAHMRASPLSDLGVQQSRELLSRPEAQAILQGLKRGEITIQHLYQQLANPALQPRHREMLVTILKLQSVNSHSASYGPSPRVLSPVPIPTSHHLYPPQQQSNQMQQQLRVSPLPPNAYCVSPIMATSPNHLTVPAMHQRIPSPRELQVHTQNILQRALIKKKLEEQTENFRKKQEMQRGVSPNQTPGSSIQQGSGSQPQSGTKGLSSPTPLAFTPTSVLRKMTADKDEGKENKLILESGVKPQGRPLTGVRQQPQVTVNNQQWNQSYPMKQAGRPIVKANNYQSQTPDQFFAQLAAQQQSIPQQCGYQPIPPTQHRKPIVSQQYPPPVSQYGAVQPTYPAHPNTQNFSLQPTPQQLRAQHQHRSTNNAQPPPTNSNNQPPVGVQPAPHMQNNQQQKMGYLNSQPGSMNWQQFLNTAAQQQGSRPGMTSNRPPPNSDGLSPSTTDQLTRWFSPDLLERARVGELPSTANLARLEEIERQAAAPVHN